MQEMIESNAREVGEKEGDEMVGMPNVCGGEFVKHVERWSLFGHEQKHRPYIMIALISKRF